MNGMNAVNGTLAAANPTLTSPSNYSLIGTRTPRIDIPAIVTGQTTYIREALTPRSGIRACSE